MLRADPRGAEPSPVAGLSVAELEEIQENIRWFSRLSVSEKLALSQAQQRRARQIVDLVEHGS